MPFLEMNFWGLCHFALIENNKIEYGPIPQE
ncbi:hypothetical protein HNQ91_002030 [Filimonas zeae]|nr:hypothetical protein [Filimonas zeae]